MKFSGGGIQQRAAKIAEYSFSANGASTAPKGDSRDGRPSVQAEMKPLYSSIALRMVCLIPRRLIQTARCNLTLAGLAASFLCGSGSRKKKWPVVGSVIDTGMKPLYSSIALRLVCLIPRRLIQTARCNLTLAGLAASFLCGSGSRKKNWPVVGSVIDTGIAHHWSVVSMTPPTTGQRCQ
jgi:hypothetical protein